MKFIYALGIVVSSYFLYKYKKKSFSLHLVHSNNRLSRLFHLINFQYFEGFRPSLFIYSGHVQTFLLELLSMLIRLLKKIIKFYRFKYEREFFELSDGCKIAIDHARKRSLKKKQYVYDKILVVLPGVTSTSDDYYVKSLVEDFIDEYECRVMNYRGFAGMKLFSPAMISTNCFSDIQEYIIRTCNENPNKKVFTVGFSFGGHLITKTLGDKPDIIPSNFYAGCGLCYPTCGKSTKDYAEIHFNGLYSKATLVNLKKTFMDNLDVIFSESNEYLSKDRELIINQVTEAQLCSDFDTVYTCRVLKLTNLDEYYKLSKLDDYLAKIKVPFFSMFTQDDPIIPISSVPFETLKNNPNTVTVVTEHGGHLAFFGGLLMPQRTFVQPIQNFFKSVEILRDTSKEDLCYKCKS
jgi:predicted alpha/beta-fold hydrolase